MGVGDRDKEIQDFLYVTGWQEATRSHVAGDASNRRYERVRRGDGTTAILMDAPPDPLDQPLDGGREAYGDIAHLAKDCRPFVAVARYLKARGLSAPEIFHYDFERGFILLEDLGDQVFGSLIDKDDDPQSQAQQLYETAVDVLIEFHRQETPPVLPIDGDGDYQLPTYDPPALTIEVELMLDWYAPAKLNKDIEASERKAFAAIWSELIPQATIDQSALTLRDFHSPNLILLPKRRGVQRVGVIDFQDGLLGSPAYDLMSLGQDARRDVPRDLERRLVERYLAGHPDIDPEAFRTAYAVLGAQRNSKIIGIFCRLWKRDGKPGYLQHMPRLWDYLGRNLEHAALSDYKAWIDRNIPADSRK